MSEMRKVRIVLEGVLIDEASLDSAGYKASVVSLADAYLNVSNAKIREMRWVDNETPS
jgi:hypothetical protein